MAYPKPSTEFPIKIKEIIYKQNDEVFNSFIDNRIVVEYYYEKDEKLFTNATLIRRGELQKKIPLKVARYDAGGNLEAAFNSVREATYDGYTD